MARRSCVFAHGNRLIVPQPISARLADHQPLDARGFKSGIHLRCSVFGRSCGTSPQPKPKTSTTVNNTQPARLRLTTNSLRETR